MQNALVRRLYGSSTASTNDLAHLDVVSDSLLIGLDLTISAIALSSGDRVQAEIATSSVCQATTNDCQGVLGNIDLSGVSSGTGLTQMANGKWIGPSAIFIPRGTRIYLHTLQAGTTATRVIANIHLVPL